MKNKHSYRAIPVESFRVEPLLQALERSGQRTCFVAIDMAKAMLYVAFAAMTGELLHIVSFRQPAQTSLFFALLDRLQENAFKIEVILESTGTYGDPIRQLCADRQLPVFRVSTKHTKDAAELYDGVPSQHDAKDAAVLAWLHSQKKSRLWPLASDATRTMRALVEQHELFSAREDTLLGKYEAKLARHWPALLALGEVSRGVSVLTLLATHPDPRLIGADLPRARQQLWQSGHGALSKDRIEQILNAACDCGGMTLLPAEQISLQALLREMLRAHSETIQCEKQIRRLLQGYEHVARLVPLMGLVTAVVVVSELGNLAQYTSAEALQKAMGLNLTEYSSGNDKNPLHISKRGSSLVRKYMFLWALRMIQTEPILKAWYQNHINGKAPKYKAVIAVMRKLAKALWVVSRGATFDASKLVDTRRLTLTVEAPANVMPSDSLDPIVKHREQPPTPKQPEPITNVFEEGPNVPFPIAVSSTSSQPTVQPSQDDTLTAHGVPSRDVQDETCQPSIRVANLVPNVPATPAQSTRTTRRTKKPKSVLGEPSKTQSVNEQNPLQENGTTQAEADKTKYRNESKRGSQDAKKKGVPKRKHESETPKRSRQGQISVMISPDVPATASSKTGRQHSVTKEAASSRSRSRTDPRRTTRAIPGEMAST